MVVLSIFRTFLIKGSHWLEEGMMVGIQRGEQRTVYWETTLSRVPKWY